MRTPPTASPAASRVTAVAPRRAPADRPRRLRPLGVGVGLFLLALFLVAGFKTWRDLNVVERREAELETSIAATEGEIAEIEGRLERLAEDPEVLERLAREELAMTYEDEVVILLPSEDPPPAAAAPRRPNSR